jgi:hypothetical protein
MATFTIRGQKLRSQSNRRYLVVACRPDDFTWQRFDNATQTYVSETLTAFGPETIRRSDSLDTAKTAARRYGFVPGGYVTVIDTVTGAEA